MVNDLDYEGIEFLVSEKDYSMIEQKNNTCINVFCYENELTYPVYESGQKFENCMDLLMIISHIMSISKILRDLYVTKQNLRLKTLV